jgi:ATP-binding protein involved in chromosome partitioning
MKGYHDIARDGGSDVLAQVAERRAKIDRNLEGVRHVLAIGSGKGGVGKSTLALHVASVLQRRGLELAILDADLNGPSQARLAGLRDVPPIPDTQGLTMPRSSSGLGVVSLGSFLPESRSFELESVARGDSWVWRATREFAVLGELLASVSWGALDCLVLDLPPGAERTTQYAEFFGGRASFVLVTVPSDVSRGVVSRSVAALRTSGARILGYVENMKGYLCPTCGTIRPLFPESGAFTLDLPCLGSVPFDPELAERCDRGRALPADGPTFEAIRAVADDIYAALEAKA